jgi:ABC-type multidrug transport system fused ATPase/permease subunit
LKKPSEYLSLFRSLGKEWKWLLHYASRYRLQIIFYVIIGLLSTAMGIGSTVASKYLIDSVISKDSDTILTSAVLAVGLSVLPGIGEKRGGIDARCEYAFAHRGDAAVEEIIRRQRIDGSWGTDFLTRQNAAALKLVPSARSAYKKALRYLRSKGLQPMSEAELNHFAERSAVNI